MSNIQPEFILLNGRRGQQIVIALNTIVEIENSDGHALVIFSDASVEERRFRTDMPYNVFIAQLGGLVIIPQVPQ